MNWRNPFLITYLSVTVAGTAILGYLLYSSYNHAVDVDNSYTDAVSNLQRLQNRVPFPSTANNDQYVEYTKQYRAEYDKLVAKVESMQKPVESISPQSFQDLLRADVSQVQDAAKENNVELPAGFYLGFDQYQGALPPEAAAGPLARELAAIRMIVDQLIVLKVHKIEGIKRDLLPEESGNAAPVARSTAPGGRPPRNGQQPSPQKVATASSFEAVFIADQSNTRAALNYIANASQFFIIRYLNIENSSMLGPKKVDDKAAAPPADQAPPAPSSDPTQPATEAAAPSGMRLLAGRETLQVSLRIEMITFNNLPTAKK